VIVRSTETGEEREFEVGERTIGLGASLHWFPDGKGVAVPAFEPGRGESLVRIDVQTGRISFLMPLPAGVGFPHFEVHPDGARVFYTKPLDMPGSGGLRLVARDLKSGDETTVVERRSFFQSALSPDGRSLAIEIGEGKTQVLLAMPSAGGESRELARVDSEQEVPFLGNAVVVAGRPLRLLHERRQRSRAPMAPVACRSRGRRTTGAGSDPGPADGRPAAAPAGR
jgi:hypothetical protein